MIRTVGSHHRFCRKNPAAKEVVWQSQSLHWLPSEHEAEIDRLVYELYGLSQDKIKVVDGK